MDRFERNALFLLLLTVSSVSCNLPSVDEDLQNPQTSNSTQRTGTDTNSTSPVQLSKENGTSEEIDPKQRGENSTVQSMDQRSLINTASPPDIHPNVTNGSASMTSSPVRVSVTVTPEMHQTKKTSNSVTTMAITTRHSVQRTTTSPRVTPTEKSTTQKTTARTTRTPCPTLEHKKDAFVFRCLVIIAVLAAVTLVFIVTTVVLATKLTSSRYRHRASLLRDTEMVCISALMNDTDHPLPHPKHPKSNGALIPSTEDEEGDDLTLNSFLPDAEGAA